MKKIICIIAALLAAAALGIEISCIGDAYQIIMKP